VSCGRGVEWSTGEKRRGKESIGIDRIRREEEI
jgi:hypothetical protein